MHAVKIEMKDDDNRTTETMSMSTPRLRSIRRQTRRFSYPSPFLSTMFRVFFCTVLQFIAVVSMAFLSQSSSSFMRRGGAKIVVSAFSTTPPRQHRRQSRRMYQSTTTTTTTTLLNNNSNKNLWSIEECLEKRDNIKFVDGSWYHKGNRNGRDEFEAGPRLPGANYLDMSDISTSKELYPELNPKNLVVMFPPPALFAATMDAMDITPDDQVVVYGRKGCWFTPRTWYLFKTYGHSKVALMQGSLEDWVELGGPIETEPIEYGIHAKDLVDDMARGETSPKYPVSPTAKDRFVDMQGVYDKYETTTVVDTRGSSYTSKGHIPGAIHIPYGSLVEADNSLRLKSKAELEQILQEKQLPTEEPILLSCGSGVSVCHMALVLDELGYPAPWVYDGSWNEWGADPDTPKHFVTTEGKSSSS